MLHVRKSAASGEIEDIVPRKQISSGGVLIVTTTNVSYLKHLSPLCAWEWSAGDSRRAITLVDNQISVTASSAVFMYCQNVAFESEVASCVLMPRGSGARTLRCYLFGSG